MLRRSMGLALAAASMVALPAVTTSSASAATVAPMASSQTACDLVASTTGNDAAAGTAQAPLRTAQRLADRLRSGQVGCLHAGTYAEDVSIGNAGITLTSFPGERATVKGRFWISQGADRVTVRSLDLNGVNAGSLPSPTINAADATFQDNDVTNDHTEICFMLGNHVWGRAVRTKIVHNRIHDCGRLPSQNMDHGIYIAAADDTQVLDNVIVDNADRGIQLYPDAQGTVIRGNIIAGNGEGIIVSGADGLTANGSVIEHNVIAGSNLRSDVESWYPPANPVGTNNTVANNCIGTLDTTSGGFTATNNTRTPVAFASAATGDYRIAASSACASILGASTAPASVGGRDGRRRRPGDAGSDVHARPGRHDHDHDPGSGDRARARPGGVAARLPAGHVGSGPVRPRPGPRAAGAAGLLRAVHRSDGSGGLRPGSRPGRRSGHAGRVALHPVHDHRGSPRDAGRRHAGHHADDRPGQACRADPRPEEGRGQASRRRQAPRCGPAAPGQGARRAPRPPLLTPTSAAAMSGGRAA